jgi:AraC-like DNA-binding protein
MKEAFTPSHHYIAPDITTDVILRIDEHGRFTSFVSSPNARFSIAPISHVHRYVGARLRAGFGTALLRMPNALHAVLPVFVSSVAEAQILLKTALESVLHDEAKHNAPPVWIHEALRCARDCSSLSIDAIARQCGVSVRTLHRGFAEWVGLRPKLVVRLERSQRASRMLLEGERSASVSAVLGFSDQAHMTREFRAVYGFTPARFSRDPRLAELFKTVEG